MGFSRELTSKELALIVCLAALYVVLGFVSISPIIGLPGKAITAAAIIAPLIGFVLGPYKGALSAALGGAIGFTFGFFALPSFASGAVAAFSSGMLYTGRRKLCASVYVLLLLVLGLFPMVGAIWLYPSVMWFQIAGLLVLVSPLTSFAIENLTSRNGSRLLVAFFTASLTATLAGQMAGSIALAVQIFDVAFWNSTWRSIMFFYPLERILIAMGAALASGSLQKTVGRSNFTKRASEKQDLRVSF